ncbi:MAG: nitrogen fixation negative regulator NifL [Gammaproteobacteria bacterium]|nr:nitrogen fixation negative regulator NifL [Gammaproteobacteria bacterium]MCP5423919.1 nitrogen fixation negative regulator NifL [Gammaproteobacteria bacterium]MCP5459398.1 nitrogen fixation negative regulator NifL [Gammaproteobacteria bacterium]
MNDDDLTGTILNVTLSQASHRVIDKCACGELLPGVFAKAMDHLALAICITDTQANIQYVNPTFTGLTGYDLDEVVGKNASILSHNSTPARVYGHMWGQLRRQQPWTGLLVNRTKQGSVYLAELTVVPLPDESGKTTHFLGMHRDVTEVHQLEQRVLNQKVLIESMVDAAPTIIALLDANSQVILSNRAYKKLLQDMRGREPAAELLRALQESLGEAFTQDVQQSFADKEVNFEPGGHKETRWFSCSGTWFRERDDRADAFFKPIRQTYLLLIANDITNLKRQQEAVQMNAMRALLAEQERMRSMRETLEGAIFQLQVPMNLIAAAHDILERRGAAHGENMALRNALAQAMTVSREALDRLQNSVPEVPPEAVVPVNINHLLREVLSLCTQRMLAGGIVVEWQPTPILPAVPGQEGRLRGMFKQLVDNALDAMESHRSTQRELRINTHLQDEMVLVTIQDTGPGVPSLLRLKVFEPFFTSKGRADRTGLGLAMVQDVVSEHRGMISIDPDYARGCRFKVLLPIQRSDGFGE